MIDPFTSSFYNPIRRRTVEGTCGIRGVEAKTFMFIDGESKYAFLESAMMAWSLGNLSPFINFKPICSTDESEDLRALVLSLGFESTDTDDASRIVGMPLVVDDQFYDFTVDAIKLDESPILTVRTFTSLLNQLRSLTFEERCLRTLKNIQRILRRETEGITCLYMYGGTKQEPVFRALENESQENGMTFATRPAHGHFLYEYLYENDYIRFKLPDYKMVLTSKGFAKLDELAKGAPGATRDVFVIRRFNKELDETLIPVFNEVGRRLDLNIKAVWESEHIEKSMNGFCGE